MRDQTLALPSAFPDSDSPDPSEQRGRIRRVSVATAAAETASEAQYQMRVSGVSRPEETASEEEQGEIGNFYTRAGLNRQETSGQADDDGRRCSDPIESVINTFPLPPTAVALDRPGMTNTRTGTITIGIQHTPEERRGPLGRRQRQER